MPDRTSSEIVTFRHPFKLSGADDVQPAGRYIVETDEELLQTLSFPAYRRLSTVIRLPGRSNSMELARIINIDPAELSAALERDAQVQEQELAPKLTLAQRVPAAGQDRKRGTVAIVKDAWKEWLGLNATELIWTALLVGGVVLTSLITWGIDSASWPP